MSESSWLITENRISGSAARRILGDVRIPGDPSTNMGLDVVDRLGWTGEGGGGQAAMDTRKRRLYDDPVVIGEYSLGPDDIADIMIAQDEPTVGGQPLRAGSLLDNFPNGLTVQYLNDCAAIIGLYAEHHSTSVVQGVWHSKPLSGTGQGMIDSVEVQKRQNAGDSQINAVFKAHGTPAMLYRQEALGDLDRADYLGHPMANIAINSQNMPDGMRLEDIVAPAFQPQSVSGEMFSYFTQRMQDAFQMTSHITDFSGGLPGVNNRTATGAQITQANSNALFTPPLQIKGEVRQRMAEIVIRLYRRHFPIDRYFALKGRYGRQQGRYLSAANLDAEIKFEVVRDSELPRNDFTKREDYTAFFMMLGGAAGYAALRQQEPELVTEVERVFNLQMHSESFDEVASLCQQRIQQMKEVAQIVVMPPMLLLAIQPTPILEEPSHDLKVKWLSDWLDTDEGQTAPPNLRAAVQLLIQFHFQAYGQQEAAKAMLMGAVQGAGMAAGGGGPDEDGNQGDGGPPDQSSSKGAPSKKSGTADPGARRPNTNPARKITGRPER